ncbi:hypothetical protein [Peptoniphilus indolicus]|uniref:Uncharacterized protein n=2 Tax=Peptoniphilus indolicus TaxID=33030 RepID=G4D0T7_9FIRM|nr:hypothetical protein [Peptoniphilus indolicus]EGY80833.1 hypothetical protein HMPREF9129_0017 [Peptoniphilus indolicus ATCC 29427]SUB74713.1 Uncharacterised protein [Peptoniphilus indolicus]
MLYRLNLTDDNRYIKLIENNIVILNEPENLSSKFDLYFGLEKDDYIWIKYQDEIFLSKVKDRAYLEINKGRIIVSLEVYKYLEKLPDLLKEKLDGNELEKIEDEILLIKTQGIFIEISKERDLSDNLKNEIELRKKRELVQGDFGKINIKTKPKLNNNFGEMIIEVHSPNSDDTSKIPATINSNRKIELKNGKDKFYVEMMKSQMELFAKLQPMSLDEFVELQKKFWKNF